MSAAARPAADRRTSTGRASRHAGSSRRQSGAGTSPAGGPRLLRVVEPSRPRAGGDRRLLAVVGGGLLFAATLAGNVGIQAQTTQGQFELERLEATARQRQADYQGLRLEVAQLEAPQRILERARQLGMVEPARITYLTPTTKTSTPEPPPGGPPAGAGTSEAAQGWSDVKPHLDRRR